MSRYFEKAVEYGFYLFIFLLPWQTRWIFYEGILNGQYWEYGSFSLYATDILFFGIFILSLFLFKGQHRKLNQFWVLILGFFLICFASIFWSQDKEISWYAILKLCEAILLFWLVLRIKLHWKCISWSLVAAGVGQSVFGIYQFFTQQAIANKWLGLAAHQPEILGDLVIETASGRWLRAYGSFPHPNMLAGFLVISLLVLIGLIITRGIEKKRTLASILLSTTSLVLMIFGLIVTFSRSAWLALGLTLLILLAINIWQRDRWRVKMVSMIIVWILLVTVGSVFLLSDLWQVRLTGGRLEAISATERSEYYLQAKDLIADYWYQGTGIGSYTAGLYNRDTSKEAWDYQPVHNIYLLIVTEVGIFGGLIFLFIIFKFFYSIAKYGLERLKDNNQFLFVSLSFMALLVIGLFDHYLWSLSFGLLFFWLVFGLWVRASVDN